MYTARSNTIQKTVSSFGRTFTLTGKKKAKAEPEAAKEEVEEEEEETFNWVFVALMSDGTLRQYANEVHGHGHGMHGHGRCMRMSCRSACLRFLEFRFAARLPTCLTDVRSRSLQLQLMSEEIARLKLGYLVQAEFLEDPPDTCVRARAAS